MRIRSTKPEFWRSETIAALDWDARLILKGVESYVDDNGVGKDSVTLICADVFPHDLARDPETIARVSRGLQALCDAEILARYTMGGERLIYVRRWKSLQRVDRPNKGRHPRPDGTLEYAEEVDESVCAGLGVSEPGPESDSRDPREDVATPSRHPRDTPLTGTGEQGNRGTGEKTSRPPVFDVTPDRAPARIEGGEVAPLKPPRGSREVAERWNSTAHSADAHAIVRQYERAIGTPIPGEVLSGVAQRIDECLQSGVEPEQIARGLLAWNASDSWSSSQIPAFVHKAAATGRRRPGRSKASDAAANAIAIAEQMIAEGHVHRD